jgi:protein-disulfide isomerase
MSSDTAAPAEAIRRDSLAGARLGIRGPPTVLVNDIRFSGALEQSELDSLIQVAIRKATPRK